MFKCEVSCEVICDVVGVPSWQGSTYWTDLEQDRDIFCLICVLKKRSNVFYSKVWMLYIMCSNKWSEISYCSYWLNGSTSRGLLYNIVVLLQHRLTQNGCPHYPQCNLTWEAIYKLGTATSRCFNKKKGTTSPEPVNRLSFTKYLVINLWLMKGPICCLSIEN